MAIADTAGGWFQSAIEAYAAIEVAKAAQPTFAPPYQPVTYGTQPGAVAFDLKNIPASVERATGIPSGVVAAGLLALAGLLAYRLIK
ncbi:MAG: hypothetical protein U0932_01050 [Thiobacillus sp.]|nr:hypothetical protein [Thiobacillus sp.]